MAAPMRCMFAAVTQNPHRLFRVVTRVSNRNYARYQRRIPINALTTEQADEFHKQRVPTMAAVPPVAGRAAPPKRRGQPSGGASAYRDTPESPNSVDRDSDDESRYTLPKGVRYEKLYKGDKKFKQIALIAHSRKQRDSEGILFLEGIRLIKDAVEAGITITGLYFTKVEHTIGLPLEEIGAPLYKVPYTDLKLWSDVVMPQGIMATCHLPTHVHQQPNVLPVTLICDNIRDPGNLGSMLRSAAAAGCSNIIATKGCVDIWDSKVLRAGAGAHFRCSLTPRVGWEHMANYVDEDAHVILADTLPVSEQKPLSKGIMERLLKSHSKGEIYRELDESSGKSYDVDESYLDDNVKLYRKVPIPLNVYYSLDYTSARPKVLIIGGETEGVSSAAHKFAFETGGEKVHIPMAAGMDSLNTAMAASILLFEIQRQLCKVVES